MTNQHSYSTILSHLIALRRCLLQCLLAIGVTFLLLYPFSSTLFHFFALPLLNQLPNGQKLLAITLTGAFFGPIKLCLFLALFLSMPFILYRLWKFIESGLYVKEKNIGKVVLISSSSLFYLGIIFAYFVIFPTIMAFLTHIAPPGVNVTPDISAYINFALRLLTAFGIAFEIPVVIFLLIQTKLVSLEALKQKRRYVVVLNFILGMLLTPDVVSQVLLAVPLCLLFEVGLLAPVFFLP